MNQYKLIKLKGEGTFSEVWMAESLRTGKLVAIKCMKNVFANEEQVNNLREIQALRRLSPHEHIITLHEILYDKPTGRLVLVFELMDCNLYEHIKGRNKYLNPNKVKNYIFQLLKAIEFMHRNNIFHRDIKPENILLLGEHIKLADFGSCKRINSEHPYTEYISTRWYRAPECLLTDGYYDYKMDLWGVGCVMFEIIGLHPLFPGNNELDQVHKIHNILGTPPKEILDRFKKHATHMEFDFQPQHGTGIDKLLVNANASPECIDLIKKLLIYDPDQRINANQAINHEYFRDLVEYEQYKVLQSNLKTESILKKNSIKPSYDDKSSRVGNDSLIEDDRSSKRMYSYKQQPSKKSQSIPPPNKQKKVENPFKSSYAHDISTEEETIKVFFIFTKQCKYFYFNYHYQQVCTSTYKQTYNLCINIEKDL
ncbi:cyclin-dependent kinase-like Serine/Threonine kinase family protein (macronuclear) [Tetrahymena thermophila SB210]|uniref:Cyclin-dependent kinase-like Serine/Threonine kinase family protein n=1 Tax=Tetrahymena thermophila (strain SB210) TaxID=312017 RepID=Q22EX9_TETTS|nr:cyclin-dependent kinase-like Serine/Threonine kinase family protein [Tetrahymena thermophila SB210]EAR83896.4 cyclin-dependent kinase-like Serine/Threonine kinase family protein [Tetrahymena thermophila SB210]|eukprot:XP_001031559.4 cyclin-dependent kinase-like Serine/Threonine kinase family protein [Tetrahymena thermophila SB210]